jgi:hypothetical protein
MADIIVFKDSDNGDIDISSGGFATIEDGEALGQQIKTVWQTFLGEWFLNTESGVDYFGKILVRQPNETQIKQELRRITLAIDFVTGIFFDSYSLQRITSGYKIVIRATVNSTFGDIAINESFNI